MKDFELLSHTADIKLRVYGSTLEQFFKNALIGMFQSIGPKGNHDCKYEADRIYCKSLPEKREIELESADLDSLLVDFLSEALYLSDVHNEAYLDIDIKKLDKTKIKATLYGIKIKGFEVVEIKAVTYHGLEIKNIDGIWQADILFDI